MRRIVVFSEGEIKTILYTSNTYQVLSIRLKVGDRSINLMEGFFTRNVNGNQYIIKSDRQQCTIIYGVNTIDIDGCDIVDRMITTTRNVIQEYQDTFKKRMLTRKKHPGKVFCIDTSVWEDMYTYTMRCVTVPFIRALVCVICKHDMIFGNHEFVYFDRCSPNRYIYIYFVNLTDREKEEIMYEAISALYEVDLKRMSFILHYDHGPPSILTMVDKYRYMVYDMGTEMLREWFEEKKNPEQYIRDKLGKVSSLLKCNCPCSYGITGDYK